MASPPLDSDPRVNLLVGIYAEAARNISRGLDSLMVAEGSRRFIIYQRLLGLLKELETKTDAWNARYIREFLEQHDAVNVRLLQASGSAAAFRSFSEQAVEGLASSLSGFLAKGRASIEHLTTRIFRASSLANEFPILAAKARRTVAVGLAEGNTNAAISAKVAGLLRGTFDDGVVSVIGKGGRKFVFPLDYYAGMVAHSTKRQARSVAVLTRAQEADHDLVRVSSNPSKTGDWCDAYRGRVFSISGAHPVYPSLASVPNGGPPFHPWCRHSLGIFVEDFHTPNQRAEVARVDKRFLMQPNEDSPNRVVRAWWEAQRDDTAPEPLKFR